MVVPYVFLAAAVLAVLFAIVSVVHRSPLINVLSLILVFFAMAALFAIIGMDFLAAIQLVVYAGAVLVLFLFVIMLLNVDKTEPFGSGRPIQATLGSVAAIGIGSLLVLAIMEISPGASAVLPGSELGTAFPLGRALLGSHLFAFEFISLLLVAAIVGAVFLAKKELR